MCQLLHTYLTLKIPFQRSEFSATKTCLPNCIVFSRCFSSRIPDLSTSFGQAQHLTHTFSITAQSAAASPSAPWRPAALGSREEAGRRGGAPAALDFTPRSRVHRAAGTRRTHLSLGHTHTCARSPHPPRAHRSYLRGSSGGGPTVSCFFSRRGPHCLQCRASRRLQSPADPSPGQLGFRALGCTPGLGRLQLLPPRVGVCPHLRGAQWAAAGAGAGARRLRRALGLLPGSGQPVQTRMALGLAAAPGRGLSPRAAPASVFVSRPAPPRHGLGGSEQRGQGSRRQRAGLGFSIIARPQRAGRQSARAVTARTLGDRVGGPGEARGGRAKGVSGWRLQRRRAGVGAPPEL